MIIILAGMILPQSFVSYQASIRKKLARTCKALILKVRRQWPETATGWVGVFSTSSSIAEYFYHYLVIFSCKRYK
jgi:hypothetical protein